MLNQKTPTTDLATKRIQLIRDYVELQHKLVTETVKHLAPSATEFDFEESLPKSIAVGGAAWATQAHGLGVLFSNPKTNVVVDAHVGFIDAPGAFDAWRLVQYGESLPGDDEDFASWQETLEELAREGRIAAHDKYDNHFVLV